MKGNTRKLLARLLALPLAASMTIGGVTAQAAELDAQAPIASVPQAEWNFAWFGTSTQEAANTLVEGIAAGTDLSKENNGAKVSLTSCTANSDGSIDKKGGKFVSGDGYDGISFYYTKLSAKDTNFSLQADVTVDYINPTPDGQEGFALLARDSVGENGVASNAWYTNSMATIGTKASYTDSTGIVHEEVKDVIGYRGFTGITDTNKAPTAGKFEVFRGGLENDPDEAAAKLKAGGTYRIKLEETDSAYMMSYYKKDSGELINSYTYYKSKAGDDPLAVIDKESEYVGFATARGCNATFSNIIFTTTDADESKWEKRPNEYVATDYRITSPSVSSGSYELVFKANADGTAKVVNKTAGTTIAEGAEVKAGEEYRVQTTINKDVTLAVEFTPVQGYQIDGLDYKFLDSYDTKTITKKVTYRTFSAKKIYVSPSGKASNSGTSFKKAVDIQTALNYAKAGQNIILQSGTYKLKSGLKIPRGLNGTKDSRITVQTDPSAKEYAVLDFCRKGSGLEIWGNYWNFKRLNVTNSTGKGCQVAGSNNILKQMNFYNNGNTGLQISGTSDETIAEWPSNNTIKNCTSMNNADAAEEDADGFAAKLTTGEGNVFDGCIAAYNADDGWDLFAKTQTGPIGTVVIKNSIAYRNGFLIVNDAKVNAANSKKLAVSGDKKMVKGAKQTLKATVSAKKQSVTWKSSNTEIAAVSAKGVVSAKKKGSVTITASAKNGKKAAFKIQVVNSAGLDSSYIAKNLGLGQMAENKVSFDGTNYGVAVTDGANISFMGTVKNSGNGNGFKMGGSAITGKHVLKNSVSYENKAKGIDSNSGPDIKVYNSTSYNNGGANIALYSNSKIDTDFTAAGVVSYRKEINNSMMGIAENIKLWNQTDLITTSERNYLWDAETGVSKNALGAKATDAMFVNLDTSKEPERNRDGSIEMHGLLELVQKAPGNEKAAGADFGDEQQDTTLWVVGDSTVSAFSDKYYIPRYGWGTQLADNVLNYHVTVENLAVSGTSSKSFMSHKNYQTLLDGMSSGDYLMIGFGHNDEKEGDTTFTSGNGDYKTEGSFAKNLYDNYIIKAQEKGVQVILVTPIARINASNDYTGSDAHITANGDYAQAVRDLGTALKLTVCDLTAKTVELNQSVDTDADAENDSKYMHAWTSKKEASVDKTHTSMFGAAVNAYFIGQELKANGSALAEYLVHMTNPMERIAYWKEISVNANYEDPVYNQPTTTSTTWPSFADANGVVWYGSVFGDVGKGNETDTTKFNLGKDDASNMHISAGISGNTGKIAGTSDGIAMYYVRVPIGKSFSLKADVTLNGYNAANKADKQQAFGLMVRDDMYVDQYVASTMGDYVAAGTTIQSSTAYNTYARKAGVLDYEGGKLAETPKAGETISMEIKSTEDGYSAKFGDNAAVTAGYDFLLNAIDGDYVYVGIFAARSIDISASNIELTIDGQKQVNFDCYK